MRASVILLLAASLSSRAPAMASEAPPPAPPPAAAEKQERPPAKREVSDRVKDQFKKNASEEDLDKPLSPEFLDSLNLTKEEREELLAGKGNMTRGELLTRLEARTRAQAERLLDSLASGEKPTPEMRAEARRLVYERSAFLEPGELGVLGALSGSDIPRKLGIGKGFKGAEASADDLRDAPGPTKTTASGPLHSIYARSGVTPIPAPGQELQGRSPGLDDPRYGVATVSMDNCGGSGVVVHSEPATNPETGKPGYWNVLLTAGHVVSGSYSGRAEVSLKVDGQMRTYQGKVGDFNANTYKADLGLITFWSGEQVPVRPVGGKDAFPGAGDPVMWVGQSYLERSITPHSAQVVAGGQGPTKTDREPVEGHSGGPLLDMLGRVVGITSAYDYTHGIFANLQSIHSMLDRNGLASIFDGARAAAEKTTGLLRQVWEAKRDQIPARAQASAEGQQGPGSGSGGSPPGSGGGGGGDDKGKDKDKDKGKKKGGGGCGKPAEASSGGDDGYINLGGPEFWGILILLAGRRRRESALRRAKP